MTHSHLRPRYQRTLGIILAAANVSVLGTGVSLFVFTPSTFEVWLGAAVVYASAVLMIIGGLGGVYAALTGNWRTERWSVPLAAGGMAMYAISVIQLAIFVSSGRASSALVAIGAAIGLLYRYFEVLGRADIDKKEHEALGEE